MKRALVSIGIKLSYSHRPDWANYVHRQICVKRFAAVCYGDHFNMSVNFVYLDIKVQQLFNQRRKYIGAPKKVYIDKQYNIGANLSWTTLLLK